MNATVAGGSPESACLQNRTPAGDREDEDSDRSKAETDSDIKDYAETTMNELLGWYGLDKLDTRGLNLKNIHHHFPSSSSSCSPSRAEDEAASEEEMTHRSRSPIVEFESLVSNPSNETIICSWCHKTGYKLFTLITSSGRKKVFCSEPCFSLCRRASFKRNKACNWCKHVRHTVNYVDFKDGDEQLQFCSDKCLNQYKMQIFCRETQAYLQMNPHLLEMNKNIGAASSKLITPDLWMRDCQEITNGNSQVVNLSDEKPISPNSSIFPNSTGNELISEDLSVKHKPSELNSISIPHIRSRENQKFLENSSTLADKRSPDMCHAISSYFKDDRDKLAQDRKKRHLDNGKEHSRKKSKSNRQKFMHPKEAPPAHLSSSIHSPVTFPGQNRLFVPPVSSYLPPSASSLNPSAAHSKPMFPQPYIPSTLLPPGLPPPPPLLNNDFLHSQFSQQRYHRFPLNSMSQQPFEAFLRLQSTMDRQTDTFPSHIFPESSIPPNKIQQTSLNPGTSSKPNAVMLPYPVFLPVPIPIPIPIPFSAFLKKQNKTESNSGSIRDATQELSKNGEKVEEKHSPTNDDDKNRCCPKKLKNSKLDSLDFLGKKERLMPSSENSSYAVTNNNSVTNRLVLTRNKTQRTE